MKIVFIGNFSVPYCSEVHYAKTFEKLGHKVVRLQENMVTTDRVYQEAIESDMLFWVHTHGWNMKGHRTMREVLRRVDGRGVPTVAYHLDLYMGLRRWNEYEDHDYFKVRHFFTVDALMADWLNQNTTTKGHYLPAGVYEDEATMLKRESDFVYDVVFVGSRKYHPEWQYRPKLVQWLERTYGKRFAHFGNDGKGIVRGDGLNRLYRDSKVVVGDTLCPDFTYPHYWSDRIYETTGRGGAIVHPFIKGIDSQFVDGKEVSFYQYGDMHDLKTKIDYLLNHDDERERMRTRGHERTLRDHTYSNRLQEIIETVKGKI